MIHIIGHRNSNNLALCKKIRRYCFASQSYASILRSGRSSQYFGAHENPELPAKIEEHIKSIETNKLWFKHPVRTLFYGHSLEHGSDNIDNTLNERNAVNGKVVISHRNIFKILESHFKNYQVQMPTNELTEKIREIESLIYKESLHELVANIIMDKATGNTEKILHEVNLTMILTYIEQLINDGLLFDELTGRISISRKFAIYEVSDLVEFHTYEFANCIFRILEVGIPVAIVTRKNTQIQYIFRLCELILSKMEAYKVDLGLLTFFCLQDQSVGLENSLVYCSLFIESYFNPSVYYSENKALKIIGSGGKVISVTIIQSVSEITYLTFFHGSMNTRILVAPDIKDDAELTKLFNSLTTITETHDVPVTANFKLVQDFPTHEEVNSYGICEIVIYIPEHAKKPEYLKRLTKWLGKVQSPHISVSMLKLQNELDFSFAQKIFEASSSLGYLIANSAEVNKKLRLHPQYGAIFGISPFRTVFDQAKNQKFPLTCPSPLSSCCASYSMEYLASGDILKSKIVFEDEIKQVRPLIFEISNINIRCYCILMINYLLESTLVNPKTEMEEDESVLWGLQSIPVGYKLFIRLDERKESINSNDYDIFATYFIPYFITNAYSSILISVHPNNTKLIGILSSLPIQYSVHTEQEFLIMEQSKDIFTTIRPPNSFDFTFPLVGTFASMLFPFGHIRSEKELDKLFLETLSTSKKWLKIRGHV